MLVMDPLIPNWQSDALQQPIARRKYPRLAASARYWA